MRDINKDNRVGSWTFLIGVIIALIFGLFGIINYTVAWILVVVGLIAGILNIGDEEVSPFLMSGAVLIIAAAFGKSTMEIIPALNRVLDALLLIFVPATIIVAVKNVFSLARH